jgi:hypothetical protein
MATDVGTDRGTLSMREGAAHGRARHERAIEVGLFLSLIVPSLIISFCVTQQGKVGFVITALSIIARH